MDDSTNHKALDLSSLERVAQGSLRVHFNQLWPLLETALRAGYSVSWIFRGLKAHDAWPGSYSSLRTYIAGAIAERDGRPARKPTTRPPATAPATRKTTRGTIALAAATDASAEDVLAKMFHPGAAMGPPRFKDPTE